MELNMFIGKTVLCAETKERCRIHRITAPYMDVVTEKPNSSGYPTHYRFACDNNDPVSSGELVFEDKSLTEPFQKAYAAYCGSQDGAYEEYGYWMRK